MFIRYTMWWWLDYDVRMFFKMTARYVFIHKKFPFTITVIRMLDWMLLLCYIKLMSVTGISNYRILYNCWNDRQTRFWCSEYITSILYKAGIHHWKTILSMKIGLKHRKELWTIRNKVIMMVKWEQTQTQVKSKYETHDRVM